MGIQIIQSGDEISINIDGRIEILTNRANDRKVISMAPQCSRRNNAFSKTFDKDIIAHSRSKCSNIYYKLLKKTYLNVPVMF